MTLVAAIETARSHKATSKHMKTLAGSSESHQEGRSIDAIYKEQEREFCNNCGKQGRNVQPTVHYVENAAKLIIGNLSADPANGDNLTKEENRPSKKLFTRLRIGATRKMMKF